MIEQNRAREASDHLEVIGELTAGIAHDFNNLLGIINMSVQFAIRDRAAPEAFANDMNAISNAVASGTDLIDSLLTFSRRKPGVCEQVIVRQIVTEMTEMFKRTLDSKIEIRTIFDTNESWYILADRSQLERSLINLVVNARDAMPDGGRLTLQVEKRIQDSLRYIVVVVEDTGEGMTDEAQARAFEPFFTTKPRGKGSGLGLATVYGVVRSIGGRIDLKSRIGKGTTFTLWLPAFDPVEIEQLANRLSDTKN